MSIHFSEVAAFKAELLNLLEQLQAEVGEELRLAHPVAGVAEVHDSGDEAEAAIGLMMNAEALSRHSEEIADCVSALKRIESGDFGFCVDCSDEIELSRLKAQPTAARCIRCQSAHEAQLRKSA